MNREIKFRFWDIKNKSMHPAYSLKEINKKIKVKGYYIPLEYIGLKDKKGTDIFEGDIIEKWIDDEFEINGGIYWRALIINKSGQFYFNEFGTEIYESLNDIANPLIKIKVIGNIYQNPELLKKINHEKHILHHFRNCISNSYIGNNGINNDR